eukprot:767987-Hanusia_phi.AAC.2
MALRKANFFQSIDSCHHLHHHHHHHQQQQQQCHRHYHIHHHLLNQLLLHHHHLLHHHIIISNIVSIILVFALMHLSSDNTFKEPFSHLRRAELVSHRPDLTHSLSRIQKRTTISKKILSPVNLCFALLKVPLFLCPRCVFSQIFICTETLSSHQQKTFPCIRIGVQASPVD